ncbi:MAG: hypothetical protein ABSB69_19830 [Solirubrobacteraceae bacterium]
MTDNDEPLRHFRSEVPPPDEVAWAAVRGAVAREIATELQRPRDSAKITRWRAPRLLAVGLAALVLTGAVAYGATTLIGVGSPAPNPPSVLTPSNIKLLGLRVADPAGGPPWGIRLALSQSRLTPRPDVAIQIGRVIDGRLGFIGQDNAFHDDHLFHAAGPNSALITPADYSVTGTPQKPDLQSVYHFALTLPGVASAVQGCSTIRVPSKPLFRESKRPYESDERFLEQRLAMLRADGPAARRYARSSGIGVAALRLMISETLKREREQASGFVSERTFATCPSQDLRTIIFGFSGPSSTSITISGLGVHESESLHSDDDGFYLFVLSNHWSYASKFHETVTCRDGRTVSGLAAPGTPDPPRCKTP